MSTNDPIRAGDLAYYVPPLEWVKRLKYVNAPCTVLTDPANLKVQEIGLVWGVRICFAGDSTAYGSPIEWLLKVPPPPTDTTDHEDTDAPNSLISWDKCIWRPTKTPVEIVQDVINTLSQSSEDLSSHDTYQRSPSNQ